ncbi:MAG: hypothetical protein ABMA13_13890 [Chthoniobacteraceae bacterium]
MRRLLARRSLAKAEALLGLLGWQQADFDPETQREVDAIQNVEREQAALNNRAAEVAADIHTLGEERAKVRAEFDRQRATLEAERNRVREPLIEIERILSERGAEVERLLAALDREEHERDAVYRKLLGVNPQTPQVRDEILHVRERLTSIPIEKTDLKAQQLHATTGAQERTAIEQRTAELDRQLRDLAAVAGEQDASFATRIKALEKEHSLADSQSTRLERAKLDPYREIGRVLAASGVAPLNQPQALTRVHNLQCAIRDSDDAIAASLADTAAEDPSSLRLSLGLWTVIAIAVALIVGALL